MWLFAWGEKTFKDMLLREYSQMEWEANEKFNRNTSQFFFRFFILLGLLCFFLWWTDVAQLFASTDQVLHRLSLQEVVVDDFLSNLPDIFQTHRVKSESGTGMSKGMILHMQWGSSLQHTETRFVALHGKIPPCCAPSGSVNQSATVSISPLCFPWFGYYE